MHTLVIHMPLETINATVAHNLLCVVVPKLPEHRPVSFRFIRNGELLGVSDPNGYTLMAERHPHVLRAPGDTKDHYRFIIHRIYERVWADVAGALGKAADAYADWLKPEPDTVVWQLWYESEGKR